MWRSQPALAAAVLCLACSGAAALSGTPPPAGASAAHLGKKARRENLPPKGKVFFGVTDTGEPSGFESFAEAVGAHPAVVETYHPYGNSLHLSLPRWEQIHARPILHISTAAGSDRHELITPMGIARGQGDDYLLRLNRSFAYHRMPAYIRPL